MRFVVSRTSIHDDDKAPCPEAFRAELPRWSYWTFRSIKEAEARHPDKEFEKTAGGLRSRKDPGRSWCLEISTLEELLAFYSTHGPLVIEPW